MKTASMCCVLVALLPVVVWAQAAEEGLRLAEQGCPSDGYEPELCERAIARLEEATRQEPERVDVQLALAHAYWNRAFQERPESRERKRWQDRSMDIYQGLVDRKVKDARPYYELSLRQEDPRRRMELLQRTVELDPKHPRAHQDMAWGLLNQGRADEAWREYEEHMEVSPVKDRQEAQENLRFAEALVRAKHPRQAAEVVEKVVEQTREERRGERCLLFEGMAPGLAAVKPEAKRELQTLRPYCTQREHLERAVKLERQGRVDEALTELERQVAVNPKPEETYVMMERLHMRKGEPAKAAAATERYLRQEQDVREKCERFRRLNSRTLRAMDKAMVESTRRECRNR